MNLYTSAGWPDFNVIRKVGAPFNYIWGGRGCGKTYSALQHVVYEDPLTFLYIRRSQKQVDILATPSMNPFKSLNTDRGDTIEAFPEKDGVYTFFRSDVGENGRRVPAGPPLGYMAALSTFANLRGFDGSQIRVIIFDEFIPQAGERELKNEYFILMNLYETVNRNRELKGEPPVILWALANANRPEGNIFLSGELLGKAIEMQRKEKNFSLLERRGIALFNMWDSPISKEKRTTVLYLATEGTAFHDMAVSNKFALDDTVPIKSLPLREFRPVCAVGELGVWQHKNEQYIYISGKTDPSVRKFVVADYDLKIFKKKYLWLWICYMEESVVFESDVAHLLFVKYFEMA